MMNKWVDGRPQGAAPTRSFGALAVWGYPSVPQLIPTGYKVANAQLKAEPFVFPYIH